MVQIRPFGEIDELAGAYPVWRLYYFPFAWDEEYWATSYGISDVEGGNP